MDWILKQADILEEPAHVLVCSANPSLNLSGGVGGQILHRLGGEMQTFLHSQLKERRVRFVNRGTVVRTPPFGLPFDAVLHAVAINGFYESEPEVITEVVEKCLRQAAGLEARVVSLPALATGFGNLTVEGFAQGLKPLLDGARDPVEKVVVCLRKAEYVERMAGLLPGMKRL